MRFFGYVIAAATLAGVPQTAMAGGCGTSYCGTRSYTPGYTYTKSVITYPTAVFIEVPTFQVLLGTAVIAPGAIQIAPLAPVATAPAVAAQPVTVTQPRPPVVAEDPRIKALTEQNRLLLQRLDQMERQFSALPPKAVEQPPPMPPVEDKSQPDEKPQASADDVRQEQVVSMLANHCAACHHETRIDATKGLASLAMFRGGQWGKNGAAETLSGATLLAVANDDLDEIVLRCSLTEKAKDKLPMPPEKVRAKYPGLTAAELADVKWLVGKLKAARGKV